VTLQVVTGDEITGELLPVMYRIYLSTIRSNPWGRQYLTEETFRVLGERFRHRLSFVLARQGDEVVAGALNVQKRELYGRYWGAFKQLRHLHFNVCYYAGIEHCIELGLERFEPGAGGSYKQLRGFDATPTWSCHYLADARLRGAVARFLEEERAQAGRTIEWYAENTSLRRGDPARVEEVRRRLSASPGSRPGGRT
jgi:predicted N-acyltransferase